MSKKFTRRQFIKRVFATASTAIIASSFGYWYARYVEPKQLEISRHTIEHPAIPKKFHNLRIVQFSDTHVGHHFTLEQLTKIVDKINGLKPDLLFFTGDLMDEPNKYAAANRLIPILQRLEAPLGKFAIYGNHDHGGYGSEIYKTLMNQTGFTLLMNTSEEIYIEDSKITIVGLDDVMLGRPNFEQAFKNVDSSSFTILLAHEPDIADRAEEVGAHMQLSGHSHGGQIQLPFFGPLITPPLGSIYYEGDHLIGPNQMFLYVNRGLGTTRLPLRFLAKPEISIFTLVSK
ncbi:metallophosphoesterase [Bacillus sp. REN16]|uniref:metallophosphoesterase n=1 Tax=Bacillus sp. REN16 TaxID=2887296 RepID=UPI001E468C5A|nr:metallophosphoesterase [Bacillus sp. REN16]MCC3357650.1 metallophosphoesterase [Bacillus sp. REN16]